jgi:hypothetical protein
VGELKDCKETKWVECIYCGWVGKIFKLLPIRFSWCQHCHRPNGLRRYRVKNEADRG